MWWDGEKLEHYTVLENEGPLDIKVVEIQEAKQVEEPSPLPFGESHLEQDGLSSDKTSSFVLKILNPLNWLLQIWTNNLLA